MNRTKKFIFVLISSSLLIGCQSLKDGLEGNKKSKSAEEFLIEKKKPVGITSRLFKATCS